MAETPPISDVIEYIGFGRAQLLTQILAQGVWFADGLQLTLVPALRGSMGNELALGSTERPILTSLLLTGVAVGCCVSGYIGDTHGRRFPILMSYAGLTCMGFLTAVANSYVALSLCLFMMGVSMGLGMPASLALVSEMSPKSWRVTLMGIRGVLYALGNLAASGIIVGDDAFLMKLDWRRDIAMGAVPSLFLGIAAAVSLKDSPLLLAQLGRPKEATDILDWMKRKNNAQSIDTKFEEKPTPTSKGKMKAGKSSWKQLSIIFSPTLAYSTFVFCAVAMALMLNEYGSAYAEVRVFPHTHSSFTAGGQLFAKYAVNVFARGIMVFPAIVLWRKVSLILACSCGCIGAVLFALTGRMDDQTPLIGFMYYLSEYLPLWGNALGYIVVYQLSVDTYPAIAAATGAAACASSARIGGVLAPFLYEYRWGHWEAFYYSMASFSLIATILCLFLPNLESLALVANDDLEAMKPLDQ